VKTVYLLLGVISQIENQRNVRGLRGTLTVLLVLLVGATALLFTHWLRKRRRRDPFWQLNEELTRYEDMRRNGLLSDEEHKRISLRLQEQITDSFDSLGASKAKQNAETALMEILATETSKKKAPSENQNVDKGQ